MLLVIDAGNTNVVMAIHDGSEWRGTWRIATDPQRTSDDYAVWLLSLLKLCDLNRAEVSGAVIGTVVPAALYHLRRLCRDWFDVEPLVARANLNWGFEIKVDNPDEVGTATTFDVVDHDGGYLGGVIAPGINLSIEALHRAAARLPRIGIGRPQAVIGRSTVPAMQSGMYWGYVGMIEGLVARIKVEVGGPLKVIATGGLAPLLAEGTGVIERIDPDLTLDGLRMLAQRNPAPTLSKDRVRLAESD
jgi:type III pantothenate kinase